MRRFTSLQGHRNYICRGHMGRKRLGGGTDPALKKPHYSYMTMLDKLAAGFLRQRLKMLFKRRKA